MDTQKTSDDYSARRLVVQFRTIDAPSDLQIIQAFYDFTGLDDKLCFIHYQTRESKHTYMILDVHHSKHFTVPNVEDIPHEVYRMTWEREGNPIFHALGQSAQKLFIRYSKRKLDAREGIQDNVDTAKPSAIYRPTRGRSYTLSIAIPGSIVANALTHEQKTTLAGHLARACAVFCVDEIVVFDDGTVATRDPEQGGYTAFADPNFFLYHVLTYLETPPHLRRALFPMHPDLKTAGALPSLDMPHHLRSDEWCPYREGVTLRRGQSRNGTPGMLVDCGLQQHIFVPLVVDEKTRLTVELPRSQDDMSIPLEGQAVSPDAPREDAGYYWGYSVRQAASLSAVFTECPYDGGYDMSIGTSERGTPLADLLSFTAASRVEPMWNRLLIVFGGVAGLESAFDNDIELQQAGNAEIRDLFDRWVNLVPGQGSRTIRTEEAVWVGLTSSRPLVEQRAAAA